MRRDQPRYGSSLCLMLVMVLAGPGTAWGIGGAWSTDYTLGGLRNGSAPALIEDAVIFDGDLYAVGLYELFPGDDSLLARYDGTTWSGVPFPIVDPVPMRGVALHVLDGSLYMVTASYDGMLDPQPRVHVGRFDGSNWEMLPDPWTDPSHCPYGTACPYQPRGFATYLGQPLLYGEQGAFVWDGSVWSRIIVGSIDELTVIGANVYYQSNGTTISIQMFDGVESQHVYTTSGQGGSVLGLCGHMGQLYVYGVNPDGQSDFGVASGNPNDLVLTWQQHPDLPNAGFIETFESDGTVIHVAGRSGYQRYDGTTVSFVSGSEMIAPGRINVVVSDGADHWALGTFDWLGDQLGNSVGRWDGLTWAVEPNGAGVPSKVTALSEHGGAIHVSNRYGLYRSIADSWEPISAAFDDRGFLRLKDLNGTLFATSSARSTIYEWKGSGFTEISTPGLWNVKGLALQSGNLVVGGWTNGSDGEVRRRQGSQWTTFWHGGQWSSVHVEEVLVVGDEIYAAGWSYTPNPSTAHLWRVTDTGWTSLYSVSGRFYSAALRGDEVLLGGNQLHAYSIAGGAGSELVVAPGAIHEIHVDGTRLYMSIAGQPYLYEQSSLEQIGGGVEQAASYDELNLLVMPDGFLGAGAFSWVGEQVESHGVGRWVETVVTVPRPPGEAEVRITNAAPNPFNPSIEIQFAAPLAVQARVEILDMRGRRVRDLFVGTISDGPRSIIWNGRDDSDHDVASGVYLVRLEAGSMVDTRRIALLR